MDRLFLIDAYAIIYRSYYAFIKSPRFNSKGMNTSTVMGFCNTLNEVITKERPTHLAVAFDHGKTFRHDAFPAYKAQREETPEDIRMSIPIIKDILNAYRIPILQVDGFEADDIIGSIKKAQAKGVKVYAAHLEGKTSYDSLELKEKSGFIIGNEGAGISSETAEAADLLMIIPMQGQVESLNAAVAATVLMYETARQRR